MGSLRLAVVSLVLASSSIACNRAEKAQEQQAAADAAAIKNDLGPVFASLTKAVAAEAPKVGATVLPARADAKGSETALLKVVQGNKDLSPRLLLPRQSAIGEDGRLFVSWPDKSPLQDQLVYQLFPQIAGAKDAPVVAFVHWPQLGSGGYDGDGIVVAAPAKPGALFVLVDPHMLANKVMRDTIHAPEPSEREVDVGLFDGDNTYWAIVSAFGGKDQPKLEAATANGPAQGTIPTSNGEMAWAATRIPELGPHAGVVVAREVK